MVNPEMPNPQLRVLIVDDSPVALAVLESVFRAEHFDVVTAGHGQEGFDLAVQRPPDLIVTDSVMPGVDGFALLGLLREHPATKLIPVVMLTSDDIAAARSDPARPQPTLYVAKVTPMEELMESVKRVLAAVL